jgi:hypothetical protein
MELGDVQALGLVRIELESAHLFYERGQNRTRVWNGYCQKDQLICLIIYSEVKTNRP